MKIKVRSGLFQKFRAKVLTKKHIPGFFPRKITVYYTPDRSNELAIFFQKYGSDKGAVTLSGHPYPWPPHTYSDLYHGMWNLKRDNVLKVFECGIGTNSVDIPSSMGANGVPGASLYAWRDYFPNAQIYGADIDRKILFTADRIKTFWVDQLSEESITSLWAEVREKDFDIILDDGLHTFEAGSNLFANSIHALDDDGVYVIEDISSSDLVLYADFFKKQSYFVEFYLMTAEYKTNDNNLITVRKRKNP
jgi:hypothetical protein